MGITKQSKDYDADGAFVKHWCPELRNVPAPLVYEPGKMTADQQNVASYLALDLGIDWRSGGDHFESLLVDYDVTSNWGNWVAAAGLTGGRVNKFNIVKQSNDYDSDGKYLRTWIPELERVRGKKIHEPWSLSRAEREQSGADEYPEKLSAKGSDGGKQGGKGGGYGSSGGKGGG